jgi:hypothetical protein
MWALGAWAWPVLVALVVAALSIAAVLVVRLTDSPTEEAITATTGPPPSLAATQPPPVVSEKVPTLPTPRTTRRPSRGRTSPAPRAGELVEWPAGTTGWTLVLASTTGQESATSRAKEASKAGLPRVGVLDSSQYSSLHPGYFVVFSGIYGSQADAEGALDAAQAKGYGAAYVREIASTR